MVKYSSKSAKALAYLKRPYNDVDIYVEDTKSPNMWLLLIRRILPNKVKLASVNPLGGRREVLDACRRDQTSSERKRLYIIDADFDLLLHKQKPRLKHLYRLRAYCVENLLLSEQSIVRVGLLSNTSLSQEAVASSFDYDHWFLSNISKLKKLFVLYAVAHQLCPDIVTTSFAVQKLFLNTSSGPMIDGSKVFRRLITLAREMVKNLGLQAFRAHVAEVKTREKKLPHNQIISGKSYLFPIVYHRVKHLFGFKGSFEQLKALLADHWLLSEEPRLVKALLALC